MTTHERLRQWVAFWASAGDPNDKGPRRPADVGPYHDKQLRHIGQRLAAIERERRQ
jgi:hypothetical protein